MSTKYGNKIEEWDENVEIGWWRESRIQLNKVIRKYNKWIEGRFSTDKLLNKIDKHLQKPYCNVDGGSCYKEELFNMKNIVENHKN